MPMTDSSQIRVEAKGRRIMLFPYSSARVARIKTLADCQWHQQEEHWTVLQMRRRVERWASVAVKKASSKPYVDGLSAEYAHKWNNDLIFFIKRCSQYWALKGELTCQQTSLIS